MKTIHESVSTPKADGYRMPGEFEPQTRIWMAWPHRTDTWAWGAKPAQKQYADVARAIAEFEPVTMCVNQVDYANAKAVFEDDENVTVIEMTTDDAWVRDTGATWVVNDEGDKRAVHWHFNAYGGFENGLYFPWDRDDQVAQKICEMADVKAAAGQSLACHAQQAHAEFRPEHVCRSFAPPLYGIMPPAPVCVVGPEISVMSGLSCHARSRARHADGQEDTAPLSALLSRASASPHPAAVRVRREGPLLRCGAGNAAVRDRPP